MNISHLERRSRKTHCQQARNTGKLFSYAILEDIVDCFDESVLVVIVTDTLDLDGVAYVKSNTACARSDTISAARYWTYGYRRALREYPAGSG